MVKLLRFFILANKTVFDWRAGIYAWKTVCPGDRAFPR